MNQLEGKTIFAVSLEIAAKDEKQAREFAAKCRGAVLNTIKITPATVKKPTAAKVAAKPAKKTATAKKPAKVAKKPAK